MTSEVEAFREWVTDRILTASDKELLGVFGYDTFDPERQARAVRKHLILLVEGRFDELEPALLRSGGEDEAHDLVIRLEQQIRKHKESLDEAAATFLRLATGPDGIPRDSVRDAAETLDRQLRHPLTIRPTRRKQVSTMLSILRRALRDYPES
jgi:hypothetical protein